MTILGADVAGSYQGGLSVHDLKEQGYDYLFAKCTQGTGFADTHFEQFRAEAEDAGMPFAAYHFLEHGNGVGQAQFLAHHIGDKSIPVMLDDEPTKGSNPTKDDAMHFKRSAKANGLLLRSHYIGQWYWASTWGAGTLLTLPRLVHPGYPNSVHTHGQKLYELAGGDQSEHWKGYGGRRVFVWQFASTALIDGYVGNVDVSAFKGTVDELMRTGMFKDYRHKTTPKPRPKPKPKPVPLPEPGPNLQHARENLTRALREHPKHGPVRRAISDALQALKRALGGHK
jgi:hypothetical protein